MKQTKLSLDISALLEYSTAGQLQSNTRVFFGNEREKKASSVQLSKIQYIPAEDGILTVKADARSSGSTYETTIQFSGVKYVSPDRQYSIPLPVSGQEISIMPLKSMGNLVEVRCTCMDFYWRFAMYNSKNRSLIGEPPAPYVKKTERQPLNPRQVPGACKHLHKLSSHLRAEGILK